MYLSYGHSNRTITNETHHAHNHPTQFNKPTMPRVSKRFRALKGIEDNAQLIAGCIAFSKRKNTTVWKNLEILGVVISSHRYLSRSDNAGRQN